MGKCCDHSSSFIFDLIIFVGNEDMRESLYQFKFGQITPRIRELSALEHLKKKKIYNVVNTLAPSFLIDCSSFMQITRTFIKAERFRNLARSD